MLLCHKQYKSFGDRLEVIVEKGIRSMMLSKSISKDKSQIQMSKDENLCAICMEQEITMSTIPCGHANFCGQCVDALIEKKTTDCPICRCKLTRFTSV